MVEEELKIVEEPNLVEESAREYTMWEAKTEEEERINDILRNSFLGELISDPGITDIGYNGSDLWIQHNQTGKAKAHIQPTKEQIRQVIKQIADIQGKELTNSEPRLETEIGFLRVNAMHDVISPDGKTMEIRVSRPRLAVSNIKEMTTYKNEDVGKLLKVFMESGRNIIISGVTGSGKTELQKLLVGYVPNNEKIILIEDTRDSHIKKLYPEKNIESWQIVKSKGGEDGVNAHQLVQSAMRGNPDWVILAETRGSVAADMLDAAKTGHSVITTLHSESALGIPTRLIPMIRQSKAYTTTSEHIIGKNIADILRIGVHLDLKFINGRAVRRIREIVEYTDYTEKGLEANYLYREVRKLNKDTGQYKIVEEYNPLSQKTIDQLIENEKYHLVPEVFLPNGDE